MSATVGDSWNYKDFGPGAMRRNINHQTMKQIHFVKPSTSACASNSFTRQKCRDVLAQVAHSKSNTEISRLAPPAALAASATSIQAASVLAPSFHSALHFPMITAVFDGKGT
jgi:hypothetical protein